MSDINPKMNLSRREWLKVGSLGMGSLMLTGLTPNQSDAGLLSPKTPHFAPKAKRVIFLFMHGGPSQFESFDYKPELIKNAGKKGSKKGKLLGIHILGHNATELMHEAQLAKSIGLNFSKIASVIHAYPSYSDAVRQPAKKCYIDNLQNNFFVKMLKSIKGQSK